MEIGSRQLLDGVWKIRKDPQNTGLENGWHTPEGMDATQDANVPGRYNEVFPEYHGIVWYYKTFAVECSPPGNADFYIEFDKVIYLCDVWLNGKYLGRHMHAEEAFMLPCGDAVNPTGENMLAVRNFCPLRDHEPIEGLILKDIPNAGRYNLSYTDAGMGGIVSSVWLAALPKIRVADVFVQPDWLTGEVVCDAKILNCTPQGQRLEFAANISEFRGGRPVGMIHENITAAPGESKHVFKTSIAEYKLWNPDDPFLYTALFSIKTGYGDDTKSVRFGFRDLRVKDGFFSLNGKRIFIKSLLTASTRNFMYQAKAAGFNMVRFLAYMPPAGVLDLCDELGLMAYVECFVSWTMRDYEKTPEFLIAYYDNMVLRARNHASVAAWGLLNENEGPDPDFMRVPNTSKMIEAVINYLPRLRTLDNSRLVMLNSSRHDNRLEIGSVSNPGSAWWDYEWGKENPRGRDGIEPVYAHADRGYVDGMGDIHVYPDVPLDREARNFLRTVGHDSKPVFLSESGFASSQDDIILAYARLRTELGENLVHNKTKRFYEEEIAKLMDFWETYDMEGVYASPRGFIRESMSLFNRQLELCFNLIRSNPMFCGYSHSDMGPGNSGLSYGTDILKPGAYTTLREGWAPLRWAVFTQDRVMYAGKPFTTEAVICNEDVLKPGKYPARFRIKGADGIVWAKDADIEYPSAGYAGLPPLAATVLKETIGGLPAGDYVFAAELLDGGCPMGGCLEFTVLDPARVCGESKTIAAWGLNAKTSALLKSNNIELVDFLADDIGGKTVFVGLPEERTDGLFKKLYEHAQNGATIVFLCPEALAGDKNKLTRLPFENEAVCKHYRNWIYHVDHAHKRHPAFSRLHDEGLCDMEFFGSAYPKYILRYLPKPDKAISVCAGIGDCMMVDDDSFWPNVNTGKPLIGLSLGEYNLGMGKIVLNTFQLTGDIGGNPVVDQMLLNLADFY